MEPLSLLLSLLALLKQFLDSPSNKDLQDLESFLEFLADRNHKQVINGINENHLLSLQIKSLLKLDLEHIRESLDRIAESLAAITSASPTFGELALSISGGDDGGISEQQRLILKHFYIKGDAGLILLSKTLGPKRDLIISGGGNLSPLEPNFVEDDLASLSFAGLLKKEFNSKGDPIWKATRKGKAFADTAFSETPGE